MSAGKRKAEVIELLDSDDEAELVRSRQLTSQRRAQRRGEGGSGDTLAAEPSAPVNGAAGPSASGLPLERGAGGPGAWTRPKVAITCPICFCETVSEEACQLDASCSHNFCVECLTTYVRGKVESGEVLPHQLQCPCVEPTRCGKPLSHQDVRRCLATAADAERYERLLLQRCVETEDDLASCPTAGCTFMFAWEEDNRKLECPLCKQSFCLVCRTSPWHRGMRCEQFQAERGDPEANELAFAQFASSQKLKRCRPKCKHSGWRRRNG
jgi:hypothetical protein